MAKDEQSNQLNLTVVALVALVAIVGLVALVMNAASITQMPRLATGSEVVSAQAPAEQNTAGKASEWDEPMALSYDDPWGSYGGYGGGAKCAGDGDDCSSTSCCAGLKCKSRSGMKICSEA